MAHYEDLTQYAYTKDLGSNYLNVGWLERRYPFQQGPVSQSHLQALKHHCTRPINLTRGIHICDLCNWPRGGEDYEQMRRSEQSGNGEIHVPGLKGVVYIAPMLILHYVAVHHYQPPQEFLAALDRWWRFRKFIYWLK